MTKLMMIQDSDWSRDDIRDVFLDDDSVAVAELAADIELAYIINNLSSVLPGWTFNGLTGTFSGNIVPDAWERLAALVTDAADYAVAALPEIRAEVDARR